MSMPDINPQQESILRQLVELSEGRQNFNLKWVGDANGGKVAFTEPDSLPLSAVFSDMIGLRDAGMLHLPMLTRGQIVGRLTRAAIEAVESDFRPNQLQPSVSIEQAIIHHPGPSRRNLTVRQKQILREIVKASRTIESEQFFFVENDAGSCIVFLNAQGMNASAPPQVSINSTDLQFFATEFLCLDPDPQSSLGSVLQATFDAVDNDFSPPSPTIPIMQKIGNVNTGGGHFQATAGHHNNQIITTSIDTGNTAAMLAQLVALTTELIGAMKTALPVEQQDAAVREIQDLVDELHKERPDLITVEGKAQGVWRRLGTGLVSFTDGAGKVADAIAKFAPWLAAAWHIAKATAQ